MSWVLVCSLLPCRLRSGSRAMHSGTLGLAMSTVAHCFLSSALLSFELDLVRFDSFAMSIALRLLCPGFLPSFARPVAIRLRLLG